MHAGLSPCMEPDYELLLPSRSPLPEVNKLTLVKNLPKLALGKFIHFRWEARGRPQFLPVGGESGVPGHGCGNSSPHILPYWKYLDLVSTGQSHFQKEYSIPVQGCQHFILLDVSIKKKKENVLSPSFNIKIDILMPKSRI